jgi:hypothetical protein
MLSTNHADPLLFHSQMEEHATMMHISPVDVYFSAVRIWSYLENATIGLAKVYVAIPQEFNKKSLAENRPLYVRQMQEYRNKVRKHPSAQQDDDDEMHDALAAMGVPHKPAIIALYSPIQYAKSAFHKQALKREEPDDEKVKHFQTWLSVYKARDCKPTLDNYLDWLSSMLDLDSMESRRFHTVLDNVKRFRARYIYRNLVRVDELEEQPNQGIKQIPAPTYLPS